MAISPQLCAKGSMKEKFKYPRLDAAKSVLVKIGVDPATRINLLDQDFEYTSCSLEELSKYINLYEESETSKYEKRVLGCYFLECLNEYVAVNKSEHPLQTTAFGLLSAEPDIHSSELDYWSDTSDHNQEHWWPITKYLIDWENGHNKPMQSDPAELGR